MTRWDMMKLSETGQWVLANLLSHFPDKAFTNEAGFRLMIGDTELKDINPTIQIMADAIDRYTEDRAIEIAREKIIEIQDVLDCAVAELVEAIECKTLQIKNEVIRR